MTTGIPGFDGKQELELIPGKVFGLRRWTLSLDKPDLMGSSGIWHPGENIATCSRNPEIDINYDVAPHLTDLGVPEITCGCGFWAYWKREDAHYWGHVAGIIEGYGPTLLGPKGFRSKKAKIIAMALIFNGMENEKSDRHTRKVVDAYEVPLYHTITDMLDAHPTSTEYWEETPASSGYATGGYISSGMTSSITFSPGSYILPAGTVASITSSAIGGNTVSFTVGSAYSGGSGNTSTGGGGGGWNSAGISGGTGGSAASKE